MTTSLPPYAEDTAPFVNAEVLRNPAGFYVGTLQREDDIGFFAFGSSYSPNFATEAEAAAFLREATRQEAGQ
jgi:hypothetical protein